MRSWSTRPGRRTRRTETDVDEKKKPKKAKKPVIEVVGTDGPIKPESKKAAIHWDARVWRRLEEGPW